MARPRVFISSTFFDLRYIRTSLEGFVQRLGYEPVLSEKGQIAYDPDIPLDESCYREAASTDIFVLIVGGRYGSAASDEPLEGKPEFYDRYESITKKEFESATERDVPIYILVERAVMGEYETFCKNRDNESIEYAHVESVNVFHLLDHIMAKRRNNPLHQFERHTEIEDWLREQWAGLFRDMIARRSEQKQLASLSSRIEELASINTSLQRYLEAVVSSVSASPEEARELIEEEQERQVEARRLREFERHDLIEPLINNYDVTLEKMRKIYEDARTIDDIARETAQIIHMDPDDLAKEWKERTKIKEWVDSARQCLGLSPLEFSSGTSARASKKRKA